MLRLETKTIRYSVTKKFCCRSCMKQQMCIYRCTEVTNNATMSNFFDGGKWAKQHNNTKIAKIVMTVIIRGTLINNAQFLFAECHPLYSLLPR